MARLPQSSESQPFPLPILSYRDIPVEGRFAHFVEQRGELTQNKWALSIVRDGFRTPFNSPPSLLTVSISLSQSSSPLLREEITELLRNGQWKGYKIRELPVFYSRLFLNYCETSIK